MKKNTETTLFLWFCKLRMLLEESQQLMRTYFVKASEKHNGIGTALLKTAEQEMKSKGKAGKNVR